jgi:hypothetical protein
MVSMGRYHLRYLLPMTYLPTFGIEVLEATPTFQKNETQRNFALLYYSTKGGGKDSRQIEVPAVPGIHENYRGTGYEVQSKVPKAIGLSLPVINHSPAGMLAAIAC